MDTDLMAVEKQITVERSKEDTFRIFTEEIGAWWPTAGFSISGADSVAMLDSGPEGRIYERTAEGTEHEWGTILEWDGPNGFTVSWKTNLDPDAHRTTWTVKFESVGDEVTRVELVHTGWEGFGAGADEAHAAYAGGWDVVLGAFVART